MDHAIKVGAPVIGINDSGGARIQEGVASRSAVTPTCSSATCLAFGRHPADLVDHGALRWWRGHSPAMTDFIFMVRTVVHVRHRSEVVKTVTHEEVTAEEAGRRRVPYQQVRRCRSAFENDVEALMIVRRLMGFIPAATARSRRSGWRRTRPTASTIARHARPDNPNKPYDIKELIPRRSTTAISSNCSRITPRTS